MQFHDPYLSILRKKKVLKINTIFLFFVLALSFHFLYVVDRVCVCVCVESIEKSESYLKTVDQQR